MRSPKPPRIDASPQHDDHDHVGRLYEQYAPLIAAYGLRRTSRADAADMVAETFLVAWRRREFIPSEPMTLPWLYGVARRVLANQARAHRRRGRLHDRLVNQFTQHHSPSSRLEAAEGFERVTEALNQLSVEDAELLRLIAWEGLTPSEIASVMDLEPEAVRQRLHRARKRLRKQLSPSEVFLRVPHRRENKDRVYRPVSSLIWELSE